MEYNKKNGQQAITTRPSKVLPIITMATLFLGMLIFTVFAFMTGTHIGLNYPSSPTDGQKWTYTQNIGLWTYSIKYIYESAQGYWNSISTTYGLSAGGIVSMVILIIGFCLYGGVIIQTVKSNEKIWLKILSVMAIIILALVVYTMVSQYEVNIK